MTRSPAKFGSGEPPFRLWEAITLTAMLVLSIVGIALLAAL